MVDMSRHPSGRFPAGVVGEKIGHVGKFEDRVGAAEEFFTFFKQVWYKLGHTAVKIQRIVNKGFQVTFRDDLPDRIRHWTRILSACSRGHF